MSGSCHKGSEIFESACGNGLAARSQVEALQPFCSLARCSGTSMWLTRLHATPNILDRDPYARIVSRPLFYSLTARLLRRALST